MTNHIPKDEQALAIAKKRTLYLRIARLMKRPPLPLTQRLKASTYLTPVSKL